MAPEQAHGKAEAASDRYSFAVTAYQLLTGRVPFRSDTPYNTLIMQMTATPPSPRQFNPALPEAVEQALLQGLAKQPAERPASCMALVHALEHGEHMNISPSPSPSQFDPEATMLAPWNTRSNASAFPQPLPAPNTPFMQPAITPMMPITDPSRLPIDASKRLANPETPRIYAHDDPTYISGEEPREVQETQETQRTAETIERPQGKITRRTLLIGGATAAVVIVAGGTALSLLSRSHSATTPQQTTTARPRPGPKRLMAGVPLTLACRAFAASAGSTVGSDGPLSGNRRRR